MPDANAISIAGSATGAVVISGTSNQVTVYLAAGVSRSLDASPPSAVAGSARGPNPYRGLAAFFEEDAEHFFGRGKEIAKLWETFQVLHEAKSAAAPTRMLPILGPSGSGKSSLARAGLVPEIARHTLPTLLAPRVVVLTPTAHPLEALAQILARLATDDPAPISKAAEFEGELRLSTEGRFEGLRRLARYVPEIDRRKLVVLVDQFEETYTLCQETSVQDAFIGNLLVAARDASADVSVILTLRTDFIGNTQRHLDLNRLVTDQGILVPTMDATEVREAITKPAANAGQPFDPALVELLVQDTVGRDGALPLLQFALQQLWDAMRNGKDPAEAFKDIGGVGGALAQEADQLYESLPEPQQKIVRRAFRGMVQLGEGVGDTRRRVDLNAIVSKESSRDEVLRVLRTFAQPTKRLVTLEGGEDEVLVEVTHEALIARWGKIHDWLGPRQREDERFHRQLAEAALAWNANGQRPDLLWGGFNLARLVAFVKRTDDELTRNEHQFLTASTRAEEKAKIATRRRTQLAWGAAVVMAVLTAVALFERGTAISQAASAFENAAKANAARIEAEAERGKATIAEAAAKSQRDLAYASQNEAQKQRDIAQSAEKEAATRESEARRNQAAALTALSSAALPSNPTRALKLALAAWPRQPMDHRPELGVTTLALSAAVLDLRERQIYRGHEGSVWRGGFSSDGTRIVTASSDHTVRFWDTLKGKEVAVLRDSAEGLDCVAFARHAALVFAAYNDKTGRLWDATGKEIAVLRGHEDTIVGADFSPDNTLVVTASADKTARVWDTSTGKLITVLRGHSDGLLSVIFSSDGKRIVTTSSDNTARMWDSITGKQILVFRGHQNSVRQADLSPDGKYLVTASDDDTACIWNAITGKQIFVLRDVFDKVDPNHTISEITPGQPISAQQLSIQLGHLPETVSVEFSPDGKHVATTFGDKTARLWDAATGELLIVFRGHEDWVYQAVFSADGSRILTTSRDKTARIWNAFTGEQIAILRGHDDAVLSAAFSPDGAHVVTTSDDKTARLWEVSIGTALDHLGIGPDSGVAFSPDETRVATAIEDHNVAVWDATSGKQLLTLIGHNDQINSVAFSPDGGRIVTSSGDKTARVWEATSGKEIMVLHGHEDYVWTASFAPDGMRIVTTSSDKTARLWDAATGKQIAVLDGHIGTVMSGDFSSNGKRILTTDQSTAVRLWDGMGGESVAVLGDHTGTVNTASFSPNGTRIVTASDDTTARLWDAETGAPLAVLRGHEGGVESAAFSPDGKRVVTASSDKTARLWDATTGQCVVILRGHMGVVLRAEISLDGKRAITVSDDKTVRLWDANTGAQIANFGDHDNRVEDAAFLQGGIQVVTVSWDNVARLWDSATGAEIATLGPNARPGYFQIRNNGTPRVHISLSPGGTLLGVFGADFGDRIWGVTQTPKGNIFQIACKWLPDHDLSDIASDYGLSNLDPICESDPPLPQPGFSQ